MRGHSEQIHESLKLHAKLQMYAVFLAEESKLSFYCQVLLWAPNLNTNYSRGISLFNFWSFWFFFYIYFSWYSNYTLSKSFFLYIEDKEFLRKQMKCHCGLCSISDSWLSLKTKDKIFKELHGGGKEIIYIAINTLMKTGRLIRLFL